MRGEGMRWKVGVDPSQWREAIGFDKIRNELFRQHNTNRCVHCRCQQRWFLSYKLRGERERESASNDTITNLLMHSKGKVMEWNGNGKGRNESESERRDRSADRQRLYSSQQNYRNKNRMNQLSSFILDYAGQKQLSLSLFRLSYCVLGPSMNNHPNRSHPIDRWDESGGVKHWG